MMVVAGTLLFAQRGNMRVGRYDPKTEVTLNGTVDSVERVTSENMPMAGIHLVVKSENQMIQVHVGPAAFVDKKMMFTQGDTIQVVGSKVTMGGKPVVIAREIKKGHEVLQLRDERGRPLWSGAYGYRHRVS